MMFGNISVVGIVACSFVCRPGQPGPLCSCRSQGCGSGLEMTRVVDPGWRLPGLWIRAGDDPNKIHP